eukprot:TRINITY_DN383_c0_g1_i2.p1 TRINITY_DN383_c0_g1~~TRINITY_DN383_c0_g1_i2.p1  ORF type:complete len:175 (-),score=7.34 TRINITY_DN383_c0_g1_i2:35-559(-)
MLYCVPEQRVGGPNLVGYEPENRLNANVLGYEQHAHLNCYTGHGGKVSEPNDGLQAGVHNVDACGRACDENYCACFVYFWKYNECFLRDSCELSECEQGSEGKESYDFDTYTAGPVNTPCFCEHGKGQWIPYDPPGTLACTCVSCPATWSPICTASLSSALGVRISSATNQKTD